MSSFIVAEKLGQTRMYDTDGNRVPVTNFRVYENVVLAIKTTQNDGYNAIKIGTDACRKKKKPLQGEAKKVGATEALRHSKEFRVKTPEEVIVIEEDGKKKTTIQETSYTIGNKIQVADIFKEGDRVDVSGTSKGKGFQGVMKRHGFSGGPRTHGQSDRDRAPGSMGSGTTPGRVFKGKKLAGRMGGKQSTIKNLTVLKVEDDTLVIKGLVPGHKKQMLFIKKTNHVN